MSVEQIVVPLPPPFTNPAPLSNIEGGETNLLHRTAWSDPSNPLKVCFDAWENSQPSVQDPESIQILLGDVEIGSKEWTAPIHPDDLYVAIGEDRLPPGVHELRYIVTIWSGTPHESDSLTITIDKTPPVLATASELVFPTQVLPPNKLTARYLETNSDQVEIGVPEHTPARPWDRITWYWGATPGNLEKGCVIELDDKNYSDPVVFAIAGDLIRNRGDGWRYAWYQVQDRAGNESLRSEPVELDVAATPIPRTLPWPTVERAVGEGEMQTLDPMLGSTGVVVEVPQEAVVYPGEQLWVQWGATGTLGAIQVKLPISPGQRRYQIEMKSVAAHIGKTLPISYVVIDDKKQEHPSIRRQLTVQTIPVNRLKAVKCDGLSGGNLSYRTVAPEGARLTLDTWPLMTTDHWVMITMTGVNASGQDSVFEAVRKRAVTDQEVIGGIGARTEVRVSKVFLNTLRRNAPLTGKAYVSFDGGQTWPPVSAPNFPLLQLTFVD